MSYRRRLIEAQHEFAQAVSLLLNKAEQMGYKATFGDAYRDPRVEYGSKSSKHRDRLAVDLNLYAHGLPGDDYIYQDQTEQHAALGAYWESIGGIWGGRFNDGNHYEWRRP